MAIRAMDMHIMTPRMPDLSAMHHAEKQRPAVEQMQMVAHQDKQTEKNRQTVRKTSEDSKPRNDDDAKNKGKNTYTYFAGKKSGKNRIAEEGSSDEHILDIKV